MLFCFSQGAGGKHQLVYIPRLVLCKPWILLIESILTQSWKNFVDQVKIKILAKEKLTIENFLQDPQVKSSWKLKEIVY